MQGLLSLCRVFYRSDNTVIIIRAVLRAKRKNENAEMFLNRETNKPANSIIKDLPYDDVELSSLPDRKFRERWRGEKGRGVYIDHGVVTTKEKITAIENNIDQELAQQTPDAIKIINLQRKLIKKDYD